MKKSTIAINTPFCRRDAYNALSMPVYDAVAYEFDNAKDMADAFTGRSDSPDYSRTANPTVTNFEQRVKALTGAEDVMAMNSGMAAISTTVMALSARGKNIVTSHHMFGNTFELLTRNHTATGLSSFPTGTKGQQTGGGIQSAAGDKRNIRDGLRQPGEGCRQQMQNAYSVQPTQSGGNMLGPRNSRQTGRLLQEEGHTCY